MCVCMYAWHACMHVWIYVYVYVYICIYVRMSHTHTHTHAHTHRSPPPILDYCHAVGGGGEEGSGEGGGGREAGGRGNSENEVRGIAGNAGNAERCSAWHIPMEMPIEDLISLRYVRFGGLY
jgi:hypothetical protein